MWSSLSFFLLLTLGCLSLSSFAFAWTPQNPHGKAPQPKAKSLVDIENTASVQLQRKEPPLVSRRDWGWKVAELSSLSTLLSIAMAGGNTHSAWAAADNDNGGLLSTSSVADKLHVVPTFTIVDAKGVPYMVVGEDAKVTGYFFTSYAEAKRILDLAKTSADKAIRQAKRDGEKNVDDLINPWTQARISTVPLDFAVTVVSKSLMTKSYFQVAPAVDDIEDALEITGKKDLAEGKVPLFYMENFTLPSQSQSSQQQSSPLYFSKAELIQDFQKQNPGTKKDNLPPILVSELFAVLLEMVKPGGTDEELKNLVLIPPKGSLQKAQQCEKTGGKEPPFVFGQRVLVL